MIIVIPPISAVDTNNCNSALNRENTNPQHIEPAKYPKRPDVNVRAIRVISTLSMCRICTMVGPATFDAIPHARKQANAHTVRRMRNFG